MGTGTITIKGTPVPKQHIKTLCIRSVITWISSIGFWYLLNFTLKLDEIVTMIIAISCGLLIYFILSIRSSLTWKKWLNTWIYVTPCLFAPIVLFPQFPLIPIFLVGIPIWILTGIWGIYRFYPLHLDTRLFTSKFADQDEKQSISLNHLHPQSHLLGVNFLSYYFPQLYKQFYCIRSKPVKKEIGNMMVICTTGGGKGLNIQSQLLTTKYSVIVNDPKGELYADTANYRETIGKVYIVDVTGVGHRFDPLDGKYTEDELRSCATQLLYVPNEKDPFFTNTAIDMLTVMFLAARKVHHPPFPFVLELINKGFPEAVRIINSISPQLAIRFLDMPLTEEALKDKTLKSCYKTLTSGMRSLLTENLVKILAGSDFDPAELMISDKPVTIYLKWKEENLRALAPMIRLTWDSIIRRLLNTYDRKKEVGTHHNLKPVLLLIDEGANPAVPSLAEHIATMRSRQIYMELYIQDLAQLDAEYGENDAKIIRGNTHTRLVYWQSEYEAARDISIRIGDKSAWAHSFNQGTTGTAQLERSSEGQTEQKVPVVTPQDIMKLKDEKIIAFHGNLSPIKMFRMDWRRYKHLRKRHGLPPPKRHPLPEIPKLQLALLPQLAEIPAPPEIVDYRREYIDPDLLQTRR